MCTLIANIEQSLLGIQIDDLGYRLHVKSGSILSGVDFPDDTAVTKAKDLTDYHYIAFTTTLRNVICTAYGLSKKSPLIQNYFFQNEDANDQNNSHCVSKLCQLYLLGSHIDKVAIGLLTPFLYTGIGSISASEDIQHNRAISLEAFRGFSLGLNSDVSSSRLKLASALYCAGDLESCQMILTAVRGQMSKTTILKQCFCYPYSHTLYSVEFAKLCYENNEDVIKYNIAFCVRYLPCEVNCIPGELKYEMFRSTEEDRPYRGRWDYWMDWAVVDSLPYVFFMQYKVYSQLQRQTEQHRALYNLAIIIHTDRKLGHRETALNLLGQCMFQEGRHQKALNYYVMSLRIRERNNAAKWHVCRLLASFFRR